MIGIRNKAAEALMGESVSAPFLISWIVILSASIKDFNY